jgi:hypothetical protein
MNGIRTLDYEEGFDKIAWSNFAQAQRAWKARRMDAPSNPSLSAIKN